MGLGHRLKNARERAGLSQKEAAIEIGVGNAVLSNYENNRRDPDTETLKKIAITYDISVDYLLGLTNLPKPLEDGDMKYLEIIDDKETMLWWEKLPSSDIEKLKTLKAMWDLLNPKKE